MPTPLPIPSPIVSNDRSCTALLISAPIAGELRGEATFTSRFTRADGSSEDVPDGSVSFTQAELVSLAGAGQFKAAFTAAAHAKRATYD